MIDSWRWNVGKLKVREKGFKKRQQRKLERLETNGQMMPLKLES
jgi:hypothetical protein